MKHGILLRLVALTALAGQLQLLPAGIACAARHVQPTASHCDDGGPTAGDAVTPVAGCHEAPACQLGVGCSSATAAVLSLGYIVALSGEQYAVPASASLAPASFDSSPAPPPPQA